MHARPAGRRQQRPPRGARPGPHAGAVDVIRATTQASRENAVQQWSKMKAKHPETVSTTYSFRFPGQRGPATEVVDLPTALQIIMLLPGSAAAAIRLKASVLLVRFLGGDLSLVADVYDMNALQEHLAQHWPEHPLARFAAAPAAGSAPSSAGSVVVARVAGGASRAISAEQLTTACSNALAQVLPQWLDKLQRHVDERVEARLRERPQPPGRPGNR